jgi:hypothetical protein
MNRFSLNVICSLRVHPDTQCRVSLAGMAQVIVGQPLDTVKVSIIMIDDTGTTNDGQLST